MLCKVCWILFRLLMLSELYSENGDETCYRPCCGGTLIIPVLSENVKVGTVELKHLRGCLFHGEGGGASECC